MRLAYTGVARAASLDARVALMAQDMAAFAADSAVSTTWRREEAEPALLFVA